jgi:hypothetical protein
MRQPAIESPFEYLAAERPVDAADIGDIQHCIRHGETGCPYPAGDAGAPASAIRGRPA